MVNCDEEMDNRNKNDLLILDLAGLYPCLNLISVPLKFLNLLLQVGLKLLLLVGIVSIVNLKDEISTFELDNFSRQITQKPITSINLKKN